MLLCASTILVSLVEVHYVVESCTAEPLYYGHIGAICKYPDYQGVQIIQVGLCNNVTSSHLRSK